MLSIRKFFLMVVLVSFTSTGLPVIAAPSISISSMYDVLRPGSDSMTKRIYNTGDSTAFVRVDILEISIGKEVELQEIQQKEISDNEPTRNRLIVTPMRLIIPPAGFQTVRILWAGEREKERYFRIRFTPVIPSDNDGFGLDKVATDSYREKALQAGVNVLTGYGTVAIVQPDTPVFSTDVKNLNGNITVKNNGDTTISLDNLRQCKTANTDCGSVSREFILPGRSHEILTKNKIKTNFTLIEGNSARELSF